jgi:hypothetical protein
MAGLISHSKKMTTTPPKAKPYLGFVQFWPKIVLRGHTARAFTSPFGFSGRERPNFKHLVLTLF